LIADGIKNTTHVKNLHIINCELKTKGIIKKITIDMNILFESLKSNDSLILLDLSHNKLDQNIGMYIGQILSAHAKKRDEIIWLLSLRGEKPLEDLSLRGN
jgi:centrosomal protein CEP78